MAVIKRSFDVPSATGSSFVLQGKVGGIDIMSVLDFDM